MGYKKNMSGYLEQHSQFRMAGQAWLKAQGETALKRRYELVISRENLSLHNEIHYTQFGSMQDNIS